MNSASAPSLGSSPYAPARTFRAQTWSLLWRMVLVLLLLPIAYAGLSLAATAVPDHSIVSRLAADARHGRLGPDYNYEPIGSRRDGFTDCIGTSIGIDPANPSVVSRTIRSPHESGCGRTIDAISAWQQGQSAATEPYWRYWHGYAVLSRPAIAVGGITGARIGTGIVLAGTALAFVWAFGRRIGWTAAVLLLAPLALASDLVFAAGSIPHGIALAVALAGPPCILRWGIRRRWPLLVAASGSAYAFVDLLTNPPLALLWCLLAVAVICYRRGASVGRTCVRLALAGVCWAAGWASTWICKWVLVMPLVGVQQVITDITHQAELRSSNADAPRFDYSFGLQTQRNVNAWFDVVTAPPVAAIVAAGFVLMFAVLVVRNRGAALRLVPLVLVTLIVPAWYEALRNHSSQHAFFVYRALPGAFGVLAAVAWLAGRRAFSPRRG